MQRDNNQQVFFELLRAGLWEKEARLAQYDDIDFSAIIKMAEEQSVVGLITAGLEQVKDTSIPKEWSLQFIGSTLQIEQRNKAMNEFVAKLIELLRKNDVFTLLVKGQGIAQCYERPLWRASGDVDLLVSDSNYEKAKGVLMPLATDVEKEYHLMKHQGMTIDGFVVELHGTLHSRLSKRVDIVIDECQRDVFYSGSVRSWQNGRTQVFLPGVNDDIVFLFTHILHHFYIEGIGLRQLCDWCRFLWTYKDSLNWGLLESQIRRAGLKSEWRVFSSLSVDCLGMPVEAMPLFEEKYSHNASLNRKKDRVLGFVLETGNFGHKRTIVRSNHYLIGKFQSAWAKMKDFAHHEKVFPLDTPRFFFHFMGEGVRNTVKGE